MNDITKINIEFWKKIAIVAASFSFVISMLLIVNYLQYQRIDPVETELINTLVERLNEDPENNQLRDEIRVVDLLARKAYFTSQWQIRTGGYLLLISVIILIIALQILNWNKKELPDFDNRADTFIDKKNARKWISISGGGIIVIALFFAFLTHNQLSQSFGMALKPKAEPNLIAENLEVSNSVDEIIIEENITEEELIAEEEIIPEDTLQEEIVKLIEELKPTKQIDTTEKVVEIAEFPSYKEIISNFNTFRGPGGNGIAYQKNIPTNWDGASGKNVLWKTKIPLHGYNSPVIWGDKLFLSGADANSREVYCIDRNTGKILWNKKADNIQGSPPTSPKVTGDTGHAAPTVATDGRRVYAIFANGDIIAFDMDGNHVWSRNLGGTDNHYGHSSSLMLFRNMLIVQYDSKKSARIMALATKSGETIWNTPRKVKISWASPVVVFTGKQTEIILSADPFVASYNPYSGAENWKIDCIYGEVGPSVAYSDSIVFATNEYASLVAIKIGKKPEILWESDEFLSDVPSPVATKDLLFLVTSYGVVACYDTKTGTKHWEHEYDYGFYSSPILVEGKIYILDKIGVTHIFSASKEFKAIASSGIGEEAMTTPAFADGRIYIRGNTHLYCIGK